MAIKTYPKGSNEQLSKNFKAYEFDCKCARCTKTLIDEKLVAYLQRIRDHFGEPVVITSAYRCKAHNAAVNGASASRHMSGAAADIKVQGVAPAEVAKFAESIGILGIGLYDTFVHIDTRIEKSFWYSSSQEYRSTFGGSQTPQKSAEEGKTTYLPISVDLPVLSLGDQGDTVEALQIMLKGRGYNLGNFGPHKDGVDGHFGNATKNAVICFQEDMELDTDRAGIVAALEWYALLGL